MKDRSYRLPTYDQSDDWVNGSWTVDCVCGVDYDDGEEMVNCDECGVWVHTRCSHFVKGDKSFACDKCKSRNSRNDSEETEVAQLLVELPTKTMKLAPSSKTDNWTCSLDSNRAPAHRPYGLWTERPMEERVHVQGIPGGESSILQGVSSSFSAELWKCCGYVPKRFNLQYREFPAWDEQQKNDESVSNKEPFALYSLSKETKLCSPEASAVAGMRTQSKVDFFSGILKKSSMIRNLEAGDMNSTRIQGNLKEERSLFSPVLFYSGKRKREDAGALKERNVKKKIQGYDVKKKTSAFKPAHVEPPSLIVGMHIELDENKGQNVPGTDVKPTLLFEAASNTYQASNSNSDKPRSMAATTESTPETLSPKVGRCKQQDINCGKADKDQKSCSLRADTFFTTDVSSSLAMEDEAEKISAVKEVLVLSKQNIDQGDCASSSVIDLHNLKTLAGDECTAARQIKDGDARMKELHLDTNESTDCTGKDMIGNMKVSSCMDVTKNINSSTQSQVLPRDYLSGNSKVMYAEAGNTDFCEHKAMTTPKCLEAPSDCYTENKSSASRSKVREETKGSPGHKLESKTPVLEYVLVSQAEEDKSNLNAANSKLTLSTNQCKTPPPGRPDPSSSVSADKCANTNSRPSNPITKQSFCNSVLYIKKERGVGDAIEQEDVKNEDKQELQGMAVGDCSKSSVNYPAQDISNSGRSPDNVAFKYRSLGSKNAASSRAPESSTPPPAVASSLQYQKVIPRTFGKTITSTLQSNGERSVQPFKAGHASVGNPTAALNPPAAGLSDEELALLLHQELNSSPRVPRIPRVRNAGGLPHLSSTAPSMISKRTTSSGGKDHYMFSRRKNKEGRKDGSSSFCELQREEARRMDRVPSSPDSSKTADEGPPQQSRRNGKQESLTAGPYMADGNELKLSSERSSPHNISEEDTGTKGSTHRTLPGLIAEIMTKGERMTYEELCSAVFPHWPNLRKQNGERYAYTSHSQAVLDCLRNRVEWASLVDRGPKTNASRKRKFAADPTDSESDDDECAEERSCGRGSKRGAHSASSKEEFPKGKRNARRRRRLAAQGKGVEAARKRRKAKLVDEDDDATLSTSSCPSEHSVFSEDDGFIGGQAGSEVSAATSEDDGADVAVET